MVYKDQWKDYMIGNISYDEWRSCWLKTVGFAQRNLLPLHMLHELCAINTPDQQRWFVRSDFNFTPPRFGMIEVDGRLHDNEGNYHQYNDTNLWLELTCGRRSHIGCQMSLVEVEVTFIQPHTIGS